MYYHLVVLIEPHPCLITSVSHTFGHHRKRVGGIGIGIDGVGHFLHEVWINWCRNSFLFPCIRYSLHLVGEGIGEGAGNNEWLQGEGHLATDGLLCYLLRPYKEVKSELLQAEWMFLIQGRYFVTRTHTPGMSKKEFNWDQTIQIQIQKQIQ